MAGCEGTLDGFADLVSRLVHVAKAMGLVDHDEVPFRLGQIRLLGTGELIGTDDDLRLLKWIQIAGTNGVLEGPRFKNGGRKEELVGELLAPLLAEVRGTDDEQPSPSLGPALRQEDACFNRLAQPHFICKDRSFGERRAECEECGLNLVGIKSHLSVGEGAGQLLDRI